MGEHRTMFAPIERRSFRHGVSIRGRRPEARPQPTRPVGAGDGGNDDETHGNDPT
jgi:hypothetical protein